jgi:hypothetical protein
MKRIQNGIAVGVLAICVAAPAMAAGARGGMASPTMMRPTTTTTHTTPTTTAPTSAPRPPGQPNQSCETTPNQPGHSISAPGSAFNPSGTAGTKYAGEQPQNSNNPKAVSQYDVACTRP